MGIYAVHIFCCYVYEFFCGLLFCLYFFCDMLLSSKDELPLLSLLDVGIYYMLKNISQEWNDHLGSDGLGELTGHKRSLTTILNSQG